MTYTINTQLCPEILNSVLSSVHKARLLHRNNDKAIILASDTRRIYKYTDKYKTLSKINNTMNSHLSKHTTRMPTINLGQLLA